LSNATSEGFSQICDDAIAPTTPLPSVLVKKIIMIIIKKKLFYSPSADEADQKLHGFTLATGQRNEAFHPDSTAINQGLSTQASRNQSQVISCSFIHGT
jgi:hypothetical protein